MVAPTEAAQKAMHGVGLSSQEILKSLQANGLIATIRMLDEAVKSGTGSQSQYLNALRAIVPNIRSLTGLLGLTSQEAERVDGIFKRVSESTGSLDTAFKTTAESAGFKFRKGLAELQVAAINIGNLIIPVLVDIVGWIEKLANWFAGLPEPMQNFATTALAVGAGLILLAKAFTIVKSAVTALSLVLSVNPYVLIIAATIALVIIIVKNWDTIKAFLIKAWDAILDAGKWAWDHLAIFILGPMKLVIDFLIDHWRGFKTFFIGVWNTIADIIGPIIRGIVAAIRTIIDVIMDIVGAVKEAIKAISSLGSSSQSLVPGGPRRAGGLSAPPTAHGGIVTSPQMRLVGEAGPEAIIPLSAAGMLGGLTVIINGDVTGEEVVRKVRDGLLKLKARNATTGL